MLTARCHVREILWTKVHKKKAKKRLVTCVCAFFFVILRAVLCEL